MFLSLSEIDSNLKQLREQRAHINSLIHYYEQMKQQATTKHYYRKHIMGDTELYQRPIAKWRII